MIEKEIKIKINGEKTPIIASFDENELINLILKKVSKTTNLTPIQWLKNFIDETDQYGFLESKINYLYEYCKKEASIYELFDKYIELYVCDDWDNIKAALIELTLIYDFIDLYFEED